MAGSAKEKRVCSLYRYLRIERAEVAAWRQLEQFHYRPGRCGAVDRIFALRLNEAFEREGQYRFCYDRSAPVGVIVYAMPVPNVALRNFATENRYVGHAERSATLRLLNREVRTITRVVIHPQFRGVGLARQLVQQTLNRAGVVLVEAMAAMGRVNPFFERAGMTAYEQPRPARAERLIEAFGQIGIAEGQLLNGSGLQEQLGRLEGEEWSFIGRELARFAQAFGKYGRKIARNLQADRNEQTIAAMAALIVQHSMTNPVYYLWRRSPT